MNAAVGTDINGLLDTDSCYGALGFSTAPFRITPDIEFLVPQAQYLEAIGHLRYGLATGSFTLLTGNVGLGKTLLCRYLMNNLPSRVRTAYIFNPQQNYAEFLASIIHDLTGKHVNPEASSAQLHDYLYKLLFRLASEGEKVALIIDEAHRLQPEILEGLRLLSNLETDKRKLLSLLLVGQNELEQTLQMDSMRALRQRISVWHRLRPFTRSETADYIRHRLRVASKSGNIEITEHACRVAHRYSKGVPRRLNQICDRALLAAFAAYSQTVDTKMMRRAAREVVALEPAWV
ncbi:MAG: ExeA family protein [bacterium]